MSRQPWRGRPAMEIERKEDRRVILAFMGEMVGATTALFVARSQSRCPLTSFPDYVLQSKRRFGWPA